MHLHRKRAAACEAGSVHHARAVGSFAAYRIERVHARLGAQGLRILKARSGLTLRQWWIIADMAELKPATPSELSRMADVDQGLLSRNLKTLADLGLVVIERSVEDQRQQMISLSEKGLDVYHRTMPIMRARNQKLVRNVTEDEFETFLRVLDRIEIAAEDDCITDEEIAAARRE